MRSSFARASRRRVSVARGVFGASRGAGCFALSVALLAQGLWAAGAAGPVVAQVRGPRAAKSGKQGASAPREQGASSAPQTRTTQETRTAPGANGARGRGAAQDAGGATAQDASPAPREGAGVSSMRLAPVGRARINFRKLAKQSARAPQKALPARLQRTPSLTIREARPNASAAEASATREARTFAITANALGGPGVPSPPPVQSFQAQEDSPKVGGDAGDFVIPPDTMGAVGLDRVFTTLNNNYRVHNKTTGAPLSTESIDTFWAATGASGPFNPRVAYDPFNHRWLVAAVSNARTANSSILIGISETADPEGNYDLFRFEADDFTTNANIVNNEWAGNPALGFNKNWVAVSVNMFRTSNDNFTNGRILIINYPQMRAGNFSDSTYVSGITDSNGGFSMHPATTLSSTEETLYLVSHLSSFAKTYMLSRITGTASDPVFTLGSVKVRPGSNWQQPFGNILPQTCVPAPVVGGCPPGGPNGIEAQDSFIRSNVVFRNGNIWYPQTVALPGGEIVGDSIIEPEVERTAAQWTRVDANGDFVDGGRVEDPTATRTNGGHWYAYPSIAVNKNNDALLGFSEFESDDFADAGYSFRFGSDDAGTMRDPFTFKEGEDYYEKDFDGNPAALDRNRWGDYSHAVVDPSNDRDLWTIQEYAAARATPGGLGENDSRWGTWWAKVAVPAGPRDLLISEFRLHGPNGALDEFVEIYNNTNAPLTVGSIDDSSGYALVASDGVARFTIPNNTVIPARGHFLGCNSGGYSLSQYPAGNGTTATCDASYAVNIKSGESCGAGCAEPRHGLALFRTSNPSNFTDENRLDSVGFQSSTGGALYKEGAGIPDASPLFTQHTFFRDMCGKGGSIGTNGACNQAGLPKDTDNNAVDFVYADTDGTCSVASAPGTCAGVERLGAPGPENLSSPVLRSAQFSITLLDPSQGANSAPNRQRNFNPDPSNFATHGREFLNRTLTNNSDQTVTRLRVRIIDITTFPTPPGFAQLRPQTATASQVIAITGSNPACPLGSCTVQGMRIEQPPTQQFGGGFNTSLSPDTIIIPITPIPPGGLINVQFQFGIETRGFYRVYINIEALP